MSGPPRGAAVPVSEDRLLGQWGHSFEEDAEGVQVYRPGGWDFPLARGRGGLELRAGGDLVEWAIAAGDGNEPRPGRWWTDDAGRVHLQKPDGRTDVAEVVESGDGTPTLRVGG
jgi:hypothetical protein